MGKEFISLALIMGLGTLATSGAGCAINDLWDRNLDSQVERTKLGPWIPDPPQR